MAASKGKARWCVAGLVLIAALALGACSSKPSGGSAEGSETRKQVRGLAAPLLAKGGSSAQGRITIYQRGDRWQLSISMFALRDGTSYQLAFFDNGNCSSPNAFSAGKVWLPPDAPEGTRADTWIPSLYADARGSIDAVARLPNPGRHSEEVFLHRSVLVFAGSASGELKPGVPNNVIACGVFDTMQALF